MSSASGAEIGRPFRSRSRLRDSRKTIRAASVTHRGPTLGYRVEADGTSVTYIPDHEPGLGASLADLEEEWISGFDLARDTALLIHDAQYTDDEYPSHVGWGHSPISDTLTFAQRTNADNLLLFHHDPLHSDDFLDALGADVDERLSELGRPAGWGELAIEREEIECGAQPEARASSAEIG